MALLLDEIQWEDPTIPLPARDPAWERELATALGMKKPPYLYLALSGNPWLRQAMVDGQRVSTPHTPERLLYLSMLVTSQESACRFCYGAARAQMRMLGFEESFIEKVERSAQVANPLEQEVIRLCRALSRSNPRPVKDDALALQKHGLSALTCAELAGTVALTCLHNRVGTLLAAPPMTDMESMPDSLLGRLMRPFIARHMRRRFPPLPYPEPQAGKPFADVTILLAASPLGALFQHILEEAFASQILPTRTKALMFMVVSRFLTCATCEGLSRGLAKREGVGESVADDVLRTLASTDLTDVERQLIPWVRDTVRIDQPGALQKRTRALGQSLGGETMLEAIGVAALANSTVRLAMLAE